MAPKLRQLLVDYNNLANPDGSALFCQGNTIVQAYVYGPVEVSLGKERSDKASLFVTFKPKNSCNKHELRMELYENYIRSVLESVIHLDLHPRTSISVILQEMQDDGCLLSVAVNSACCALIDAGIPMKNMIASVTCFICQSKKDNDIEVDLNKEESEEKAFSSLVLTFESVHNNILSITNDGDLTTDQLGRAIKQASVASSKIYDFYHESMKKRFLMSPDS